MVIHCQQRRVFVVQRTVVLFHVVEDMALDDKGVLPTVIVKILEPYSPAGRFSGERAEAGFEFLGTEGTMSVIVKGDVGLVRKLCDEKVRKTVVVVILKDNTHAGKHFAITRQRRAGFQSAFGESAVAVVMEKELIGDVIGDKNVGEAVAIVIGEGDAQTVAFF